MLDGSIRASGERVRCNAKLIDAETDAHIWAERFDLHANDLLWLQDEVTARTANALDLELVQAEAAQRLVAARSSQAKEPCRRGNSGRLALVVLGARRDVSLTLQQQRLTLAAWQVGNRPTVVGTLEAC